MKILAKPELYGILGGGQLARMLVESARLLGIEPRVYCASPDDPAAQIAAAVTIGSLEDANALASFLSQVNTVIFESEFVSRARLESAARGSSVRFVPTLPVIERLQNKLSQKRLLNELGIATAAWVEISAELPPNQAWVDLRNRFPMGFVLKVAEGGYDGKGNWLSKDEGSFTEFVLQTRTRSVELYAEERVPFRRELALVAVRGSSGEWREYPAVVSVQEKGICREVRGPATAFGVSTSAVRAMSDASRKVAESLGIVGAYAIEFFETLDGAVLVNELAPRVHNSGHVTQDASETSQFENHWRAVLGMPLGETRARGLCYGMWNSLGEVASLGPLPESMPAARTALHGHGYGKKACRPGRKMGQIGRAHV